MDWVKVASLAISAVSAVGTFSLFVVVLEIRNAILTERDTMKDWVRKEIREQRADGR
jgi:hypothetical protein